MLNLSHYFFLGNGFACQNLTTNSGLISGAETDQWGNQYSDDGLMTITVENGGAELVNIFTQQQAGQNWEPNLWASTVTK